MYLITVEKQVPQEKNVLLDGELLLPVLQLAEEPRHLVPGLRQDLGHISPRLLSAEPAHYLAPAQAAPARQLQLLQIIFCSSSWLCAPVSA